MAKKKTKDPAVLWFYGHYLYGTRYMTFVEKGVYAELLNVQADHGALDYRDGVLSIEEVQEILEKSLHNEWKNVWNKVKNKFTEKDGVFYNERMRAEQANRQGYCKSRSKNGLKKRSICSPHADHMGEKGKAYAINQIKSNQIKLNNVLRSKVITPKDYSTDLSFQVFEKFRLIYPGVKRGGPTEFEYFKKKFKDWETILPLLYPAFENQVLWRSWMASAGMFVPEWRYLKSWITQRGWEDQQPVIETRKQFGSRSAATEAEINAQAERVALS